MAVVALCSAILGTGCLKSSDNQVTPLPKLTGDYEGKFYLLKRKSNAAGQFDTTKANIKLNISDTSYTVFGDTTGKHANSIGGFAYNYYYIEFHQQGAANDTSKRYLKGLYAYYTDGSKLQLVRTYAIDTVRLIYDLKKKTN